MAANIAQARLMERLRDSEGASYSPSASVQSSFQFPDWGFFFAGSEIRPERADLFFRLAREIVADLARTPVSADEWQRAMNPVVTGIERRLKTNGYWAGAMEDWSRRAGADRACPDLPRRLQVDDARGGAPGGGEMGGRRGRLVDPGFAR